MINVFPVAAKERMAQNLLLKWRVPVSVRKNHYDENYEEIQFDENDEDSQSDESYEGIIIYSTIPILV